MANLRASKPPVAQFLMLIGLAAFVLASLVWWFVRNS